jgi:3-oxoacyl-[acyl-carrier protein] reductase
VITGGTKGLGKALVEALVKESAEVVTCARTYQPGQAMFFYTVDVTNKLEVQDLGSKAHAYLSSIDIWINNAGITQEPSSIADLDWEKTQKMLEVNLFGLMYGCQTALKHLGTNGIIINILSRLAKQGNPKMAGYVASKWAARGFIECLRLENPWLSIINVYPRGIKTDMSPLVGMTPEFVARKIIENLEQPSPLLELDIEK